MGNPWLDIALSDYEAHMALPGVGQAQMLADEFELLLRSFTPRSVAVVGCAGGNGFDRIRADVTTRVVGVDVNPAYLEVARARFAQRLRGLELHDCDIQCGGVGFAPVDLMYAALVLEYLDPERAFASFDGLIRPGGVLGTVLQHASATVTHVSPSPYREKLQRLEPIMHLLRPEDLAELATRRGYLEITSRRVDLPGGKSFQAQWFRVPGGQ